MGRQHQAMDQRAVEKREKWRKLVAKSSVVPHRPSRSEIDDDDDEKRTGNQFKEKNRCSLCSQSLLSAEQGLSLSSASVS